MTLRLPLDSIRARLLAAAALWLTLVLLAAWWFIGGVLERFVTERFDAEAAVTREQAGREVEDVEVAGAGTRMIASSSAFESDPAPRSRRRSRGRSEDGISRIRTLY